MDTTMYRVAPPDLAAVDLKSGAGPWPGSFQVGLCSCGGCDCRICMYSCFCPCYVAGKVAEKVGEHCFLFGLLALIPTANWITRAYVRNKVRTQHGIDGNLCYDIMAACCCYPCTLCQESKETNVTYMAHEAISRE